MPSPPPAYPMSIDLRLSSQHYSCRRCGLCCRRFRIAINAGEAERLGIENPGKRATLFMPCYKGGARCIFLDDNQLCTVHSKKGEAAKPLPCRAYPFEFMSTFPGEVSIMARFDCPAVLAGDGTPIRSRRSEFAAMLQGMRQGAGFTAAHMDGLNREAIEEVTAFMLRQVQDDAVSFPALRLMANRLDKLGRTFVNDLPTLRLVLPTVASKAIADAYAVPLGVSWAQRIFLRRRLLYFIRRDEELPDTGFITRLRQMTRAIRIFCGFGNAAGFGAEHPDYPMRRADIFNNDRWPNSEPAGAFLPFRRFIRARLETLQFFGHAMNNTPFFAGLSALLECHESALLLARLHAASADHSEITSEDAAYATAAIDHCLGRRIL